jgi:hypothetical protein
VNREEIGDKIAKLKKDDREKSEGRCEIRLLWPALSNAYCPDSTKNKRNVCRGLIHQARL